MGENFSKVDIRIFEKDFNYKCFRKESKLRWLFIWKNFDRRRRGSDFEYILFYYFGVVILVVKRWFFLILIF